MPGRHRRGQVQPRLVSWLRAAVTLRVAKPRAALIRGALATLAAGLMAFSLAPVALTSASASTTPKRILAIRYAEHRAGHWYCWGGTGPSCYDCSGLVMKAYRHAGINLPRTTYGMLHSSHLRRVAKRDRKRGDLAFYGSGHVELVTNRGTFGALQTGTRIGWHHPSGWWHPTMYFRVVR
jgi:cell wall-associated NlpC family hydrolase